MAGTVAGTGPVVYESIEGDVNGINEAIPGINVPKSPLFRARFSARIIDAILRGQDINENFIDNLLREFRTANYYGHTRIQEFVATHGEDYLRRILSRKAGLSTRAERQEFISQLYDPSFLTQDDTEDILGGGRPGSIEDESTDPAGSGGPDDDFEYDAWTFETEIEIEFQDQFVQNSFEDIESETNIQDPSGVGVVSEIEVNTEISVDPSISVDDDIDVFEEVTHPDELLYYPTPDDLNLDFTDFADELFAPREEYKAEDATTDQIEWIESEIDEAQSFFESTKQEFISPPISEINFQDIMIPDDEVYSSNIVNNDNIIDFSTQTDDATLSNVEFELVDGLQSQVPFFAWMDSDPVQASVELSPF